MKIVAYEEIHVAGGFDIWSFLKLTTDDGLVGWSEFSEERARRGLTNIVIGMAKQIVGEDPRAVNRIVSKLQAGTRSAAGSLQSLAIGAIENACLDLKAKALGVPVYELFGGALRQSLPLYWSHCGMYRAVRPTFSDLVGESPVRSLADLQRAAEDVPKRGYKALKTNLLNFDGTAESKFIPQVARGRGLFELNIDSDLLFAVERQLDALRQGAGRDVRLMMDLNFNYKTEGFRQIAKKVEPFDLQWLEMDSYNPEALAFIRRSCNTPIASLEAILGRRALLPFLEANAVDVGIIDALFNGLTESVKMASLLDIFDVNAAAHNTYSPLGTLITAHFCSVIPNFRVMEYDVDEVPWRQSLITAPLVIDQGELKLPNGIGWGADIDENVARSHPAFH